MPKIMAIDVVDVRFPGSAKRSRQSTVDPDGSRSATYVMLRTDTDLTGHGIAFGVGRGNALCVLAAGRIAEPLVGRDVDEIVGSLGETYRQLAGDDPARWAGSDRGVRRLATAVVLNAVWDLAARRLAKPLWRLVAEMDPAELVAACDFRYLSDALTTDDALEMLQRMAASRAERLDQLHRTGYPAYATLAVSPAGSGRTLRQQCRQLAVDGWSAVKIEVGIDVDADRRRLAIARDELGPECALLVDAGQRWDVPRALAWVDALAGFDVLRVEEPTGSDDVAGLAAIRAAVRPVGIAAGSRCHSAVTAKQMLAGGALDYCRVDATRLAGVNEILPVLLLAARYGVPISPNGVGPGPHMAMVDFVSVTGSLLGRLVEYDGAVRDHFAEPAVVERTWYRPPPVPGSGAAMKPASVAAYRFPDGSYWRAIMARR
jgi:L-fuconate dehydratase